MAESKIYGVHPVREALTSGKKLERIMLRQGTESPVFREIMQLAQEKGVPVQFVPQEKLNYLAKGETHQGMVAIPAQLDYANFEETVEMLLAGNDNPVVVLLDGVSDVRNFGAIARTCECAGVGALILPAKGGAAVNQDAVKTSAGALLRIPTCKVPNLRTAVFYLKQSGFRIVGASEKTDGLIYDNDFTVPTALIMGAEGAGISRGIVALCDALVAVPLLGSIGSLNVSAATAVVLYEAVRQRIK
jgi:23S rRNA (guanosine2251-2'-O)-methyltransferase